MMYCIPPLSIETHNGFFPFSLSLLERGFLVTVRRTSACAVMKRHEQLDHGTVPISTCQEFPRLTGYPYRIYYYYLLAYDYDV